MLKLINAEAIVEVLQATFLACSRRMPNFEECDFPCRSCVRAERLKRESKIVTAAVDTGLKYLSTELYFELAL